jgi:hypothetical protein
MRRADEKNLTQRREGAKGLTWRLCVFSEASVRINMGDGRWILGYRLGAREEDEKMSVQKSVIFLFDY